MNEKLQPDNEEEISKRLPEVNLIRGNTQSEVIDVFIEHVPSYFWIVRASQNHHPPDERGVAGTWLHTKRVFTAYTMLEPTFRTMGCISPFEANCARAAILLHDAFKYGRNPESDEEDMHEYANGYLDHLPEHTDPNHDVEMAELVRNDTEMPEEVAHAIECHGGSNEWYGHNGPKPDDDMTLGVHLADVIAANSNHGLPVYKPRKEIKLVTDVSDLGDEWAESLEY